MPQPLSVFGCVVKAKYGKFLTFKGFSDQFSLTYIALFIQNISLFLTG